MSNYIEDIKFSVLIPYYNEGIRVKPTIESLQNQSYENWELICVDDGSTDDTAAILNDISLKDNRIKVVKKQNEGSPAKAINYGIQFITGDYYFYSSKDDFFSPDFFESAYNVLTKNDLDAVYPNFYLRYSTHDVVFFSTDDKLSSVVDGQYAAEMIAFRFKYPGNAFVRTSIVKSIGCHTFSYNADEYSAMECLMRCSKVGFCNSIFYYSQDDPNAFTKVLSRKFLTGLETNLRVQQLFKTSNNKDLIRYLKQYGILYYYYHLYWFFSLKYKNISCNINKEDFFDFYHQYRDSLMAAPVTNFKLLFLKCISWNFNLLYYTIKIKFYIWQFIKRNSD